MPDTKKQVAPEPMTFRAEGGPDHIFDTLIKNTSPENHVYGCQITFTGVSRADYDAVKKTLKDRKSAHKGAVFKSKYDAPLKNVKYVRQDAIRAAIQPTLADIFKDKLNDLTVLKHFTDEGRETLGDGNSEGEADFAWKDKREEHNNWPSGVVEIGYIPSTPRVADDAAFWFSASKGAVHVVLAIEVSSKGELEIKLYESKGDGESEVKQTVHIIPPPAEKQPAEVKGAPIVFKPSAHQQEPQIEFGEEDLKRIGEEVWFVLKDQMPTPGVWTTEGGKLPTPES